MAFQDVEITGLDAHDMVGHWLGTPCEGYLGSSYGQDLKRILQNPLSTPAADAQLRKLRADVPILGLVPSDQVNLWSTKESPDKLSLYIEVSGRVFAVPR